MLEALLAEDDEVVHVWYLLGWTHCLQGDVDDAREVLTKV